MITSASLLTCQTDTIMKDKNNLVVAPHKLLYPFIANYTFTNPRNMPDGQAVLPTASTSLVCAIRNNGIVNSLRGVNIKPVTISGYARQFDFMFLIEFHSAGLYPFLKIDQNLLADDSFLLEELSKELNQEITEAYCRSNNIGNLKQYLDMILLSRLDNTAVNPTFNCAIQKVLKSRGTIPIRELAGDVYYSEKQLNRLFQKHVGTGIKTFTRIVRMKNAVDLFQDQISISKLIEITGHYDYAHFLHDFKDIYGITPKECMSMMSLFYNDPFKL